MVYANIAAGNVFEPRALNELFPTWKEMGAPLDTPVTEDAFVILTSDQKAVRLPNAFLPPQQASGIGAGRLLRASRGGSATNSSSCCWSSSVQHNDGNYVISLSQLVRWLGQQAEELGMSVKLCAVL